MQLPIKVLLIISMTISAGLGIATLANLRTEADLRHEFAKPPAQTQPLIWEFWKKIPNLRPDEKQPRHI